jgi:hypothetical protein
METSNDEGGHEACIEVKVCGTRKRGGSAKGEVEWYC